MDNLNSNTTKIIFDYHVFLTQKFGGISRYFIELYKEFNKHDDVKVDIPLKYAINEYAKNENINFVSVRDDIIKRKYLYKYYAFRNQQNIKRYLNENEVDILHSTWYSPYVYNLKGKHKLVFTVHDMIQELFYQEEKQFDIQRRKKAIFESDAIIAVSHNTKKDILNIYPEVNENKIKVIHSGVNNFVAPCKFDIPITTQRFILFVGQREKYKNGLLVIESLAELLKQDNISLVFVGGGCFNKSELEQIHKLNIEDYVVQISVSDCELAYLYNAAECFVFPSQYEGFGFPILEAFVNNCPVICSNSSSFPEIAEDAAIYFNVNDGNDLVKKVKELIYSPSLQNEYRKKGKKQAQKFNWKITAEKTLELYQSLVYN